MSARAEARAHLAKAGEFLSAAESSLGDEMFNAAAANAVTSGINSKDAVCITLTGRSAKTQNHAEAVRELRSAGADTGHRRAVCVHLAAVLGRLLRLKTRAQYDPVGVARADATRAVAWARALLDGAADLVGG